MSTDIKPGQVRRWNHVPDKSIVIDSVDGVKVTYHQPDGATFTSNAVHLGYATNLVGWDVTPTDDATPAPLDPAAVKAGDTVTLERGSAVVKGEVSTAYPPVLDSEHINQYVAFALADVGGSMFVVGGDHPWTITAHQPAPEPEPQQGFGTACVQGYGRLPGFYSRASGGSFVALAPPGGYVVATGDEFVDFRPAVVIDSAEVDWRGLQSEMSVLVVGAEPFKRAGEILDVVRRELGLADS